MKWYHKCSIEWLKARQGFLTATDIKELLPVTKTGRKRVVGDEAKLKVVSRKLANISEEDCISTGAAARGHVLEPYAIEAYNNNVMNEYKLYHWDDVIIAPPNHRFGGLGFSPDALDFEQPAWARNKVVLEIGYGDIKEIGEVKSYGAENHILRGYTDKKELEERWQLATAMAVCPSIDVAHLIFFNPSMKNQMFVADYERADLADEISIILEIEDDWLKWLDNLANLPHHLLIEGDGTLEKEIVDKIIKLEELNPDGEKSVVL